MLQKLNALTAGAAFPSLDGVFQVHVQKCLVGRHLPPT